MLVIADIIVMLDEGIDLLFEISWQIVVVDQDSVLKDFMPALDLAQGLHKPTVPQCFSVEVSSFSKIFLSPYLTANGA